MPAMTGNVSVLSDNPGIGDFGLPYSSAIVQAFMLQSVAGSTIVIMRSARSTNGRNEAELSDCPASADPLAKCSQCTMKTGTFDPSIMERVTPPKIRSRILECP